MFEVAAALGLSVLTTTCVTPWLRSRAAGLDPAEIFGVSGLLSLGLVGSLTLIVGLAPGGTGAAVAAWPLLAMIGATHRFHKFGSADLRFTLPRKWPGAALLVASALCFIPLVAVLAPSDARDWDTLAYHLAVPKLWLESGQIDYVPGIHQSNFPFVAELVALHGVAWGGQTGGKAFSLAWLVFGAFFVFGSARRRSSEGPAWVAVLAFLSVPVVLWESGTAYIDVPHGLFAGLAVAFAADWLLGGDRDRAWLAGAGLGLAMATKHTGIQVALALILAGAWVSWRAKTPIRSWMGPAVVALAFASPWWLKSWTMTGNPVFPFLYEVFGGRDWDAWRAAIYRHEQKSFGVGSSLGSLGYAVLGLAFQPGRYVNPGQQMGLGFPSGALGMAPLLAAAVGVTIGRPAGYSRFFLSVCLLLLTMWFFLSQQSRYLTIVAVPLVLASVELTGNRAATLAWRTIVAGQVLVTAAALILFQTAGQLPVALGVVSRDQHQARTVGFYVPSQVINRLDGRVKVALYDEVFGFFLDTPYFWANPGHSTLIPYGALEDGTAYAGHMVHLGFTHAYLNLDPNMVGAEFRDRWMQAAGLLPGAAFSSEEREAMRKDLNLWWRFLAADAVRAGRLERVESFGSGPRSILFRFAR
jgi:4-amino-4-deoxy-L-arabinose transferase-like glycosyltransferase